VPAGSLAEPFTFRLRLLVAVLVEAVSHYILQIDVLRAGTKLIDPTGRYEYEVAAACSGIRSLVATLALALVLGVLSFRSWWKRLAMLASAVPLAVLGNLLRMLVIIIAAEIGGREWGMKVHDGGPGGIFTLLLYVPAFLGLLWLEMYLRRVGPPESRETPAPEPPARGESPLPATAAAGSMGDTK
jgi:exosortase